MAVEGHLTMKKHTTTNQSTVLVMGGGCVTRFDLGGMCVGDDFTSFGAANEATKAKKINQIVVLAAAGQRFTQQPTKNIQERQRADHKGCAT